MFSVRIEFDPAKDKINIRRPGVSLALAEKFDWSYSYCWIDDRFDYGEERTSCVVFHELVVYHVTYTEPKEGVYRIISLREATNSEEKVYGRMVKPW
jgi:uncharacterized DUF497 family protein